MGSLNNKKEKRPALQNLSVSDLLVVRLVVCVAWFGSVTTLEGRF
jgi:hypothetical protein